MLRRLLRQIVRVAPHAPYVLAKGAVMAAPTAGDIDTIRLMVRSKSASAYNINTVMILYAGQGLKALYYCCHPLADVVFGQCVLLLVVATALALLRFRYTSIEGGVSLSVPPNTFRRPPRLFGVALGMNIFDARGCGEFAVVLALYACVVFVILWAACLVIEGKLVVDAMGLIANLIEATVSLPMFYRVVIHQQIENISVILVFQYITADVMKIALFWITGVPCCFIFGASCQSGVDIITVLSPCRLRRVKRREEASSGNRADGPRGALG
jgi:hypothetical protein